MKCRGHVSLCEKWSDQFLDVYIQEINQETVQVFPGLNFHWFTEVFAGKRAQGCPALFNFLPSKPFQRLFPKRTFLTWDSFKPRLRASFFLSVLLIYFCFWNIFSKAFLWSSEKTALLNMPLRDLELDSWVRSGSTLSSPSGNRWEIPITSSTFQRNIKCCSL